jgi:hypothetical protein
LDYSYLLTYYAIKLHISVKYLHNCSEFNNKDNLKSNVIKIIYLKAFMKK